MYLNNTGMNIVCCQSIANNDNDGDRDSIYTSRLIDYILRLIESRCRKIELDTIDDRSNITATTCLSTFCHTTTLPLINLIYFT